MTVDVSEDESSRGGLEREGSSYDLGPLVPLLSGNWCRISWGFFTVFAIVYSVVLLLPAAYFLSSVSCSGVYSFICVACKYLLPLSFKNSFGMWVSNLYDSPSSQRRKSCLSHFVLRLQTPTGSNR